MPDLLGATNPVPGYDGAGHRGVSLPPPETGVPNVVDPSRVVRPDGRAEQQDAGDAAKSDALRYGSNLHKFLQRLRETPGLTDSLGRLVHAARGTLVSSGLREGSALEISQFLEMLQMDEAQLAQFLLGQLKSGSRFGGALFALLREAYASAQSDTLRSDILQFLKKYSDFSSTAHIEGNLLRALRDMSGALPASWARRLDALTAQVENGIAAGDRGGTLELLRQGVLPLLSDYVSATRDVGRARELLSLLTLDLVRYENGAEQSVLQAFRQLTNHGGLKAALGDLEDGEVLRLLRETEFSAAARNDAFAGRLAALAARALRGEGSAAFQEAMRGVVSALLVNESVYMPLAHCLLPLEWNGRAMFSELWVDPDAGSGGGEGGEAGGGLRLLVKMDIQGLGLFDVLVNSRRERVSLQVACPPPAAAFSQTIARALGDILTANGLEAESVQVTQMDRPLTLSEVFPKIFSRKDAIDVKV